MFDAKRKKQLGIDALGKRDEFRQHFRFLSSPPPPRTIEKSCARVKYTRLRVARAAVRVRTEKG